MARDLGSRYRQLELASNVEAGEGNRTLIFSLEVGKFPQCFQKPFRHFAAFRAIEIATEFLFVGMATSPMRVLAIWLAERAATRVDS